MEKHVSRKVFDIALHLMHVNGGKYAREKVEDAERVNEYDESLRAQRDGANVSRSRQGITLDSVVRHVEGARFPTRRHVHRPKDNDGNSEDHGKQATGHGTDYDRHWHVVLRFGSGKEVKVLPRTLATLDFIETRWRFVVRDVDTTRDDFEKVSIMRILIDNGVVELK